MSALKFILLLLISINLSAGMVREVIYIDDIALKVEVALTKKERRKGLMYRKELSAGQGMLFVFKIARYANFWMKNTYIPLSIAFINEQGLIVTIKDMQPLSLSGVSSDSLCRYALEVPKGWFKANDINVNDKVVIPDYLLKKVK